MTTQAVGPGRFFMYQHTLRRNAAGREKGDIGHVESTDT